MSETFEELNNAVKFLSGKYDELLDQIKSTNKSVQSQSTNIKRNTDDLKEINERYLQATSQIEDLSQYLRRDCLEITGIKKKECSTDAIVKSIGTAIGVPVSE